MTTDKNLLAGARNLLVNCADLQPTESLLIVAEDPALGWYDAEAPQAVAEIAQQMGVTPHWMAVGAPGNQADPKVVAALEAHDCTVFFSRMGDQDRFGEARPANKVVMSYARTAPELASSFGRTNHGAFLAMKEAVNRLLLGAGRIEITCPLGTDYVGTVPAGLREDPSDVTVRRFPMGVPLPLDTALFSGRVAVARFLTPTGCKVYDPASLKLEGTVFAEVQGGKYGKLSGDAGDVQRMEQHYQSVAEQFGLDPKAVLSFHAGIHPGSAYQEDVSKNPDRWSNTIFCNPRFLHFHTCGAAGAGEICWMILDQTVAIDGQALWEGGRLRPEAFAPTKAVLEDWPELEALYAAPSNAIGLTA